MTLRELLGEGPEVAVTGLAFDNRLVVFWGVFGVRPAKDGVALTDPAPDCRQW